MKILLLEDDALLSTLMCEHLKDKHEVVAEYDGQKALETAMSEKFELLLLDIQIPSVSGWEVLREVRRIGCMTPAIFITSLSSAKELKKGFELGADDYIRKPFEFDELDARITHIERTFYQVAKNVSLGSGIYFLQESSSVQIGEQKHILRQKEAQILLYLAKNKERFVSYEELCSNIWSYDDQPSEATIRTYMKNLRQILGKQMIGNIRGMGWRLEA